MRTLRWMGLLTLIVGCASAAPTLDLQLENATDPVIQVFEDESIAIRFTAGRQDLAFDLQNKTNGAIRILWDDIVLEDAEGAKHRLVHSGADFANLREPQQPTMVAPNARVQDSLTPKDHIARSEENPDEWAVRDLLMPKGVDPKETKSLTATVVGKSVKLMMPLIVGGQRQAYVFRFTIVSSGGPAGRGAPAQHGERERVRVLK